MEFTGELAKLVEATSAVEMGGVVVLAGRRATDPGPMDLYPDVHARSLRLIGVQPAFERKAEARVTSPMLWPEPASGRVGERITHSSWFEVLPRDAPSP